MLLLPPGTSLYGYCGHCDAVLLVQHRYGVLLVGLPDNNITRSALRAAADSSQAGCLAEALLESVQGAVVKFD